MHLGLFQLTSWKRNLLLLSYCLKLIVGHNKRVVIIVRIENLSSSKEQEQYLRYLGLYNVVQLYSESNVRESQCNKIWHTYIHKYYKIKFNICAVDTFLIFQQSLKLCYFK